MTAVAVALTLPLASFVAMLLRRRRPRRGYVPTIDRLRPLATLHNEEDAHA